MSGVCLARFTSVIAFLAAATCLWAASPALPNLVGTWLGEHAEANADGPLPMLFRLEIHRQEGPLLWATDVWTPIDPQTGSSPLSPARIPCLAASTAPAPAASW